MPEGQTGGYDLYKLWNEAAAEQGYEIRELPREGVIRFGMEGDKGVPFSQTVREIHSDEFKAGLPPNRSVSRFVELRKINGEPCTSAAMDAAAEENLSA